MMPFPDDTLDYFTNVGNQSGWVALLITAAGCTDTSECNYACVWGIEELENGQRELIRIVDVLGRNSEDKPNKPLIYIYSDGTSEKLLRIE
jgi:hypothetical protein